MYVITWVLWMVSGLLVSFKTGSKLEFENLNAKEKFEDLRLRNKYGFDLGWYTFGENIQVILRCDDKGETQIYLADNKIEAEHILNEVVRQVVDDFSVDAKDQKAIFDKLRKHGCCYF